MKCEICETELSFRWTDSHGLGACLECGAPHIIYHYGEDNKRIDKEPECSIKEEWKPLIKRYWDENKRNCAPGAGNFPGSSYEVATPEDFSVFNDWMDAHESEHPRESGDDGI